MPAYFVVDCTLSIPVKIWNRALKDMSQDRAKTGKTQYAESGIRKGLEHISDEDILQEIVTDPIYGQDIQVEDVEDMEEFEHGEQIGGHGKEKPKSREDEITEMDDDPKYKK